MVTIRITMMAVTALGVLAAMPAASRAQPGQPPPPGRLAPPGYGGPSYIEDDGYYWRHGLALGFGIGVGAMNDSSGPLDCATCRYEPFAGGFDFHIGGMLNPRLALLFELAITNQQIGSTAYEDISLYQAMVLIAAQYWLLPRLWIKGGIGLAHLSEVYDDGYAALDSDVADGGAILGAVGYELLSAPHFALDANLRLGLGSYDAIQDNVGSVIVGVAFNWY